MTISAERESDTWARTKSPTRIRRHRPAGWFQSLPARPGWLSQHLGTAIIGAVAWVTCSATGSATSIASGYDYVANSGVNSIANTGGIALGALGWLLGIGALNYPLAKMIGREPAPEFETTSWTKYFRYTADHKVVGMQYVIGVLTLPVHRRSPGHGHPDRAADADQPRLRTGHLHRHRERARHDDDDDGHLGGRRTARQLARSR